MNTARWNIAVEEEIDQSVRMFIAAQPDKKDRKKGALRDFVEKAVRAYLFEQAVDQAKAAAANMSETELSELIDEAVQWAHEH